MVKAVITASLWWALAAGAAAQTTTPTTGSSGPSVVEDIRRGVLDGTTAGRRSSVLLPFTITAGTSAALALTDGADLTNNYIVTALVRNTAISAGVSFLTAKLFKPGPSREQREALAQQSSLYANSWRRGFRDSAANRQFIASAVGVLAGAALSATIYSLRAE